jgi:hypothetical protein
MTLVQPLGPLLPWPPDPISFFSPIATLPPIDREGQELLDRVIDHPTLLVRISRRSQIGAVILCLFLVPLAFLERYFLHIKSLWDRDIVVAAPYAEQCRNYIIYSVNRQTVKWQIDRYRELRKQYPVLTEEQEAHYAILIRKLKMIERAGMPDRTILRRSFFRLAEGSLGLSEHDLNRAYKASEAAFASGGRLAQRDYPNHPLLTTESIARCNRAFHERLHNKIEETTTQLLAQRIASLILPVQSSWEDPRNSLVTRRRPGLAVGLAIHPELSTIWSNTTHTSWEDRISQTCRLLQNKGYYPRRADLVIPYQNYLSIAVRRRLIAGLLTPELRTAYLSKITSIEYQEDIERLKRSDSFSQDDEIPHDDTRSTLFRCHLRRLRALLPNERLESAPIPSSEDILAQHLSAVAREHTPRRGLDLEWIRCKKNIPWSDFLLKLWPEVESELNEAVNSLLPQQPPVVTHLYQARMEPLMIPQSVELHFQI